MTDQAKDQERALKKERLAAVNLSRAGHASSKVLHIKQHSDLLDQLAEATTRESIQAIVREANDRDKVVDDSGPPSQPQPATETETKTSDD